MNPTISSYVTLKKKNVTKNASKQRQHTEARSHSDLNHMVNTAGVRTSSWEQSSDWSVTRKYKDEWRRESEIWWEEMFCFLSVQMETDDMHRFKKFSLISRKKRPCVCELNSNTLADCKIFCKVLLYQQRAAGDQWSSCTQSYMQAYLKQSVHTSSFRVNRCISVLCLSLKNLFQQLNYLNPKYWTQQDPQTMCPAVVFGEWYFYNVKAY